MQKKMQTHPKPAHPAPAMAKKLQMQKKLHFKTIAMQNELQRKSFVVVSEEGRDPPPQTSPSSYHEAYEAANAENNCLAKKTAMQK